MKKNKVDRTVYQSLTLVMQFGLNMLVPIGMMSALGYWLDTKFGTSWIMIVLFFVGAIAGFQNVYRMAMKVAGKKEDPSSDILNKNDLNKLGSTKNDSGEN